MGTRWIPMTRMEPQRWLLGDGSILTEPNLEMTATGRKVRMAGAEGSVFASQVDGLLSEAASAAARNLGTEVWLPLPEGKADKLIDVLARRAGVDLDQTVELHFVRQPGVKNVQSRAYWRFKDPNSPFEALASATLTTDFYGAITLQSALVVPYKNHIDGTFQTIAVNGDSFGSMFASLDRYDQNAPYQWSEFIRDNPEPLPFAIEGKTMGSIRAAVEAMHRIVQTMEDTDTIKVPHLGNPGTPSWLTLELYQSNVSGQFVSDLAEYLDGSPTVDKAVEVYQELLALLKSVGLGVEGKSNNDFLAALLAGDKAVLNVRVSPLSDLTDNGTISTDDDHTLDVHLPTGTFVVNCSHGDAEHRSAAADHWEEAKVRASLTGELPELLAFARRDIEKNHGRRSQKIMKARK